MGDLFTIQKGKKKEPFNVILFGVPGIGKTSWAAQAPAPIFLGGEETFELDISRLPTPKTYDNFVTQIDWVLREAQNNGFETLVIDTLDSVEGLLHKKVLDDDPKGHRSMGAAHGGYMKAYDIAADHFFNLKEKCNLIRKSGLNLIFLAHSKKVQATDADLAMQYDTYNTNLHPKAESIFVDWVSAVFFANYIIRPQSGTNTDRVFAAGEGERVMRTEKRPGHLGKNRFTLPYEMPLDFMEFKKYYDNFFEVGPDMDTVWVSIEELISHVQDEDVKQKAMAQATQAREQKDSRKLFRIADRLREITKA